MPSLSPALLVCLLTLGAAEPPAPAPTPTPLSAQPPAADLPPSDVPMRVTPEAQPPAPPDSAQKAYDDAFKLMVAHRWADAGLAFQAIIASHPESPEAALSVEMERLARTLAADHLALKEPVLGESAVESSSRAGRVELLTNTTIFGLWTGGAASIIADTGAASLLLIALGGGAGLGLGYLATEGHPITPGGASLIGTAMLIGAYDGPMTLLLLGKEDGNWLVGASVVGGLALTGVATLAQAMLHITPGTSAMITSGAFIGTFLSAMIIVATVNNRPSDDAIKAIFLAGTNLGAIGMAAAAAFIQPSRGRVVLCGVGGFLGGLLVGGVLLATSTGTQQPAIPAGLLTVGVAAGVVTGILLTRHYDDPDAAPEPAAPKTASLEAPSLWIRPNRGSTTAAVGLNVLQGAF